MENFPGASSRNHTSATRIPIFDVVGQFDFGVEDVKIRNVQRIALSATSLLLLFATVATIAISKRNCIQSHEELFTELFTMMFY